MTKLLLEKLNLEDPGSHLQQPFIYGQTTPNLKGMNITDGRKILAWLGFLVILAGTNSSQAATITVKPGDQIQASIDAAVAGDTIKVEKGIYYESLILSKPIKLMGEGMPLLDLGASVDGIILRADGIIFSGFEIRNSRRAGIVVASNHSVISHNIISRCAESIAMENSQNNSIVANVIKDNDNGIHLFRSRDNHIKNNIITDNKLGEARDCGIILAFSSNNTIRDNNVSDNGDCSISLQSSRNNLISNNTVSNNRWYGILLSEECSNNIIRGNNASKNGYGGIFLESSRQNNIEDNIAEENGGGIYLAYHCYDNTIKRNTVSKNKKGIHLAFHSSNNTITENTAINNQYGIYLTFSSGWNSIFNNRLVDNEHNAYDMGRSNSWDNGSLGNYYSDLGSRYNIPGGSSVDQHPIIS